MSKVSQDAITLGTSVRNASSSESVAALERVITARTAINPVTSPRPRNLRMVTPSYAKHPQIHVMRESLAGMIRAGRYSVNAAGPCRNQYGPWEIALACVRWRLRNAERCHARGAATIPDDLPPKGDKQGYCADSCVPACRVRKSPEAVHSRGILFLCYGNRA